MHDAGAAEDALIFAAFEMERAAGRTLGSAHLDDAVCARPRLAEGRRAESAGNQSCGPGNEMTARDRDRISYSVPQ